MRKIDRLRKEALQSCNNRGHSMKRFRYASTSIDSPSDFGYSECRVCKAHVVLDTSPAPNGIDISGTAVAIDCPAGFREIHGRDPVAGKDFDPDNVSQDEYEYLTSTGRYKS